MGTARAVIHPRFRNRYSKMVPKSNPFPRNRSIARSRNWVKRMKTIISREKKKGRRSCFRIYLVNRRMVKITLNPPYKFIAFRGPGKDGILAAVV
jgi:hypothetical protein